MMVLKAIQRFAKEMEKEREEYNGIADVNRALDKLEEEQKARMPASNEALLSRGTVEIYQSFDIGVDAVDSMQDETDEFLKEQIRAVEKALQKKFPTIRIRAWID